MSESEPTPPKRRGRPHLPEGERKARKSGKSGATTPPTPEQREECYRLLASLRARLAHDPEALGKSRLSQGGILEAPAALAASRAGVSASDLSAVCGLKSPRSASVMTILKRLQGAIDAFGGEAKVAAVAGF